jgi:hypothetical protein
LLPIFLYNGDQGRLLELCDRNASDFVARHTNPVQPIRLVTVPRRSSLSVVCGTEARLPGAAQASDKTVLDCSSSLNGAAAGDEEIPVVDDAPAHGTSELPSAARSSLGGEFLTTPIATTSAPSSARLSSRTGLALPAAAQRAAGAFDDVKQASRKAADVFGDVLEGAFGKFNKALPAQWPSPANLELQRALQASADLHMAREKSAAESRARLAKVLDKYQVKLRPVEADGNCQFRALSVQLSGDEAQHAALRLRVTQQLRERRERYEGYMLGNFEEYLERMEKDGEWGDNVTLQAASDILKRDILVLTDAGSELLELHPEVANEEEQHKPSLCLAFLTEVHYDAVLIECE